MDIKLLEWDTMFFKKRIGRVDLNSYSDFIDMSELDNFDIVYVFTDYPVSFDAPLVDIKITYSKLIENVKFPNDIVQFDFRKHDYDQLINLVYQSGHASRFLKDTKFGIQEYKRLYKQWIDNSINQINSFVLVHINGSKIDGFITFRNSGGNSQIDLIAVNPLNHGKGIGKKLIHAVENNLVKGVKLFVATQEENIGACRFYERLGFKLEQKKYIYHYHHDTI